MEKLFSFNVRPDVYEESGLYIANDVRIKTSIIPETVQAYINNIVFPKSLDEVLFYATEHGCFNVEDILNDQVTTWTVPNWTKVGDVVFFMHSKTSISTITALKTELHNNKSLYSAHTFDMLDLWLERGRMLYKKYGGKIFALGKVVGAPEYIDSDDFSYEDADLYHWNSRIYADIELHVLDNPIDISQFNSFIKVNRQGAITGVWGEEFYRLKTIITKDNKVPTYYKRCVSSLLPISQITRNNWLEIGNDYRRCFLLEAQFRSFYTNFLLSSVGDQKTIFSECRCKKNGYADTFVDNIILINGKYLPVEIKLLVSLQRNIKLQVAQYCNTDSIIIDAKRGRTILPGQAFNTNVLVIDTDAVYLYYQKTDTVEKIMLLNDITSTASLRILRDRIISRLD